MLSDKIFTFYELTYIKENSSDFIKKEFQRSELYISSLDISFSMTYFGEDGVHEIRPDNDDFP